MPGHQGLTKDEGRCQSHTKLALRPMTAVQRLLHLPTASLTDSIRYTTSIRRRLGLRTTS